MSGEPNKDDCSLVPLPSSELAKAGAEVKSSELVKRGLRDLETAGPKLLHMFKGHADGVRAVAWSPDGSKLVSGGLVDGALRVWEVAKGKELHALKAHEGNVHAVAWSPDGSKLVSGGGDHTARVWNIANGEELYTLKGHESPSFSVGPVFSVAWSPDGSKIASCGRSDPDTWPKGEYLPVWVWDVGSGKAIHRLDGHYSTVYSVAWSPDGSKLASGGYDGTTRVWDVFGDYHTIHGHESSVQCVAWSPDGSRLASGSYDTTIKIWSLPK